MKINMKIESLYNNLWEIIANHWQQFNLFKLIPKNILITLENKNKTIIDSKIFHETYLCSSRKNISIQLRLEI